MSNVIAYPAPRKAAARRPARVDPIIAEIVEALLHFRGQAHRDEVCNFIASRRTGRSLRASAGQKQAIYDAFHAHLAAVAQSRRARSLLHLPFGEDSHRWGLTLEGQHLFGSRLAIPSV